MGAVTKAAHYTGNRKIKPMIAVIGVQSIVIAVYISTD